MLHHYNELKIICLHLLEKARQQLKIKLKFITILLSNYNNENYKLLEYEESENVTPLQRLKNNMTTFIREVLQQLKITLKFITHCIFNIIYYIILLIT